MKLNIDDLIISATVAEFNMRELVRRIDAIKTKMHIIKKQKIIKRASIEEISYRLESLKNGILPQEHFIIEIEKIIETVSTES